MDPASSNAPSLDELLKQIEEQTKVSDPGTKWQSQGTGAAGSYVSQGMENITSHEDQLQAQRDTIASVSPLNPSFDEPSGVGQLSRGLVGGGATVADHYGRSSGLSSRQQRLPRFSYRMLGSIAAVLVLALGLGTSVFLSGQSQDIRQYASDPERQEIDPELAEYMANEDTKQRFSVSDEDQMSTDQSQSETWQTPAAWYQRPVVIGGISIVVAALLLVAVFLHWLFAV